MSAPAPASRTVSLGAALMEAGTDSAPFAVRQLLRCAYGCSGRC